MKEKIGIIGFGEIGKGLNNVYVNLGYTTSIFDPYQGYSDESSMLNCDILNVCIPYSESFVEIINGYQSKFTPKLTVIHSTVKPGTTKNIKGKVCHSPVRGIHPNLDDGIRTFLKFIGSEEISVAREYEEHLETLGISSYICKNSLTTEFAKLMDTTYYGVCIAYHNEMQEICEEYGISFYEVMTKFNISYNIGYSELGKTEVVRPVLFPGGKIGGHCVVPNARILQEFTDSLCVSSILKYE